MLKSLAICLFVGILSILPARGFAATSFLSDGSVNTSKGTPDDDLKYEGFEITPDGFITGFIVNDSARPRPGVKFDMWTTNMQETRIFWRKTVTVGDLAPHAKVRLKEAYPVKDQDNARTKFMFRLPSEANFRNKGK